MMKVTSLPAFPGTLGCSRRGARSPSGLLLAAFVAAMVAGACGGKSAAEGGDGDSPNGDGDGDTPNGDGDGDTPNGDGDGDGDTPSGDGDGDTPNGDGDGDTVTIGPAVAERVDLLFVVDNSVSMADKQEILTLAVPQMVERLVNPLCVDAEGNAEPNPGACLAGTSPEFEPVEDLHIGVISSSLGGHGSRSCPRVEAGRNNDDQAHLIGSLRGLSEDFLAWNGGDAAARDALVADFVDHVSAAGESGCGFEAPLEAWYRFLIDPQPPQDIVLDATSRALMATDAAGVPIVDGTVLEQRAAFLRPDSLVAIVVLTDENDCSVMDGGSYYSNAGFGYLVSEVTFELRIATSACESNPNDACCFSCLQGSPPSGCEPYASECSGSPVLTPEQDRANVRCFENKRRFGVDLLYPTERYVEALTQATIIDARNGTMVNNPLLRGADGTLRNPDLVLFAGIVGVPWQDVATQASLEEPAILEYLTAPELAAQEVTVSRNGSEMLATRWEVMIGDPGLAVSSKICQDSPSTPGCGELPVLPDDPFMIESIAERPAGLSNPISGDLIVDSTSTDPTANDTNGHEANHAVVDNEAYTDGAPANDDLQYACIFPLATPKMNCTVGDQGCDCGDEPLRNRPICQPPAGGAASTTQNYGKAYPGTRILQVLRDFGDNAIVGSICPKVATGDPQDPNFGYNPAMRALIERMKEHLPEASP